MPPLAGVAVKVTEDPGQNGLGLAVMDTDAGSPGMPVMTSAFEVAGFPDTQAREEFRRQVTTSPEIGLKVKLGLFVPALTPFTFHW